MNRRLKKIITMTLSGFLFMSIITPAENIFASEAISQVQKVDFEQGKTYHGFKLEKEQKISEYNAIARLFVHEKTGAKVFQFKNDDKNKYFSITLKTPVDDNTGKSHVLEHALLMGGSEKYPIKQLLNYFLQGSLCNEINGYTMQDRTYYPFATVNEDEYNNLMDVYLDMVFNAKVKSSENIFKEEAWHHEIFQENEPIEYNGVVFNEMRGSLSNPISKLAISINRSLFPDTTYNYISGGDPKHIPELNYEELVEFYDEHYTPSNSLIFIYGDTEIEDKLKHINEEYLNKTNGKKEEIKVQAQKPLEKRAYYESQYGIGAEEVATNKDMLTLNYVIGDTEDIETLTTAALLTQLSFNNQNSAFHSKMSELGFPNVSVSVSPQQIQTVLSVIAQNTEGSKKAEFEAAVMEALKAAKEEGIDKELFESTLNSFELSEKLSASYGAGTGAAVYDLVSMAFAYDYDMFSIFDANESMMNNLNNAIESKHFEKFIQEKLIDNKFTSVVTLEAVPGLNEKEKAEEIKKLQEFKDKMTNKELSNLIQENKNLVEWQSEPAKLEELMKLPMIDVNELEPEIQIATTEHREASGVPVIYHESNVKDVNYLNLYFEADKVKQEQIPYIQLLSQVLTSLDTKSFTNNEFTSLALKYTAGIQIQAKNVSGLDGHSEYRPLVFISSKSLNNNMMYETALINEMMNNMEYDNKERMKLMIDQLKAQSDAKVSGEGSSLALSKNLERNSQRVAYENLKSGLAYNAFLSDLCKNFDEKYPEIVQNLQEVSKSIFNKDNLTISVSMENDQYRIFENAIKQITARINKDVFKEQEYSFDVDDKNEAYVIQAPVNYNVQSFNLYELGFEGKDATPVLVSVINDFLWDTIRVKGGAYGAYAVDAGDGTIAIYTYRDPRVGESYSDLKLLPNYLRDTRNYQDKLNQYKLNSLKGYYDPEDLFDMADTADITWFEGITKEDLIDGFNDIRDVSVEDIKAYADVIEKGLNQNKITTVGNKESIEKSKDIFDEIKSISGN